MDRSAPGVTELLALEDAVSVALRTRDDSNLDVIGRGEISIALGWPSDEPRFVCKRTPPFREEEFDSYRLLVDDYVSQVQSSGIAVVDTTVVGVEHARGAVGYVVQPMLDSSTLGPNVLGGAEPDPDHPFLSALADAVTVAGPLFSIDAQVTNFAWDGTGLTLVDVGTPFLWSDDGSMRLDMAPFARMLPTPARRLAIRELTQLADRWKEPRLVAVDVVANLYREGLVPWVEPMVAALNRSVGRDNPITALEAQKFYEEDRKTFPLIVRLQRIERWWQETVRRQPYEWFIWSTFDS